MLAGTLPRGYRIDKPTWTLVDHCSMVYKNPRVGYGSKKREISEWEWKADANPQRWHLIQWFLINTEIWISALFSSSLTFSRIEDYQVVSQFICRLFPIVLSDACLPSHLCPLTWTWHSSGIFFSVCALLCYVPPKTWLVPDRMDTSGMAYL